MEALVIEQFTSTAGFVTKDRNVTTHSSLDVAGPSGRLGKLDVEPSTNKT